jgi:hypothetical protein
MALSFDGATKRITLSAGTVTLPVRELWSRACDWLAIGDNSKWGEVCTQVGGDIIEIPIYVFLAPGWKIIPQSADHTLTVNDGVLYSADASDPFADPAGSYKIRINRATPGIALGYNTSGSTGPTPSEIAAAVRAELAAELAKVDATISSRATLADIFAAV